MRLSTAGYKHLHPTLHLHSTFATSKLALPQKHPQPSHHRCHHIYIQPLPPPTKSFHHIQP
ncbi:hypothetical protein Hanom_Chr04g00350551 [Helianthus anomalus]